MNRYLNRAITEDEISTFEEHGVVCLRQVLDMEWVERMRVALDRVLANPGPQGVNVNPEGTAGRFAFETFMLTYDDDFRAMVLESPIGQAAAAAMRSTKVNVVFDFYFTKEPHSPYPTEWHQDIAANPVEGWQVCGTWVPLDSVTSDSGAVEFIVGSHKWGRRFSSPINNKGAQYFKRPDGVKIPEGIVSSEFEPLPDFEAMRDQYEVVHFDTEPGDCVVNHGMVVHCAPGNATDRRRRAIAHRWAGDDSTYADRQSANRIYTPQDPGLKHGDPFPPDHEFFLQAWPRA